MPSFLTLFILPFLSALAICLVCTPFAIKLAWKLGLIDDPSTHKHPKVTHTYPVPRGGGLPILIALTICTLIWIPLDQHLLGVLLGAIWTVAIGLLDDRWDLSPYVRLGANIISALIVVGFGIGIAFVSNPIDGSIIDLSHPRIEFQLLGETRSLWILADIFAVIWIVGLMNSIGMGAGGIEGQLPGVVAIAAFFIALLSLQFSADITQWPVTILTAITSGAYLGFLPWNFFPQKIMPGYSGKSLAGFLLAVSALLVTAKVGTALVVLGIPLADVFWSIIRRIRNGKSPFWGDRGHLHHRLLDAGYTKKQIVIFYWIITFLLGMCALLLNSEQKIYTIITVGLTIGVILLWLPLRST